MGAIQNIVSKPIQFPTVEMIELGENGDVVERTDRLYQSRAQRWSGVNQNKKKKLLKVIGI